MLDLQHYLVKEKTGMFKTANAYDILNPEDQQPIGLAQEKPNLFLRMVFKKGAPTSIEVRDANEQLVFTVHKPFKLVGRPKIKVTDAEGNELGYFVSKMFSMGGGFHVYSPEGEKFAEVKGNWKGKEFQMLSPDQVELGKVSQKWAGMAKEMFTSSDNYVVGVSDDLAGDTKHKMLLLAAALTVDMVLKED